MKLLLQKWKASRQTEKLAFGLSYEDSEDGLSPENLKGEDRTLAEVIACAAGNAGCRATIGLLTLWECGSSASDGDDYYDRYSRYNDDDEDQDDGDGVYTMLEVHDESLTAKDWVGLDGTRRDSTEFRQSLLRRKRSGFSAADQADKAGRGI